MDFDDTTEAVQHTMTIAEDMNGHQQTNSLLQQAVLVMPEQGRKGNPTDLTDAQWQQIAPLLPPITSDGHQPKVELRKVVNGILYIVCDSHDWRSFPHDLPPRGTVYSYFRRWQLDGTLQRILDAL